MNDTEGNRQTSGSSVSKSAADDAAGAATRSKAPVVDRDENGGSAGESREQGTTKPLPPEFGGRKGPEPTRYGDWEKNGRCIDF